jgi:DNA polymerase III subunit delta
VPTRRRSAIALLWGDDAFLVREAALRRFDPVRPTEVEAAQWQGAELQDLATPSLFGEPRALLISDARSLSKDATTALAAYLSAPDPEAQLVICFQVAERGKVSAALEKLVKPVGDVEHIEVKRKDLEAWVARRASDHALDLSMPAARELVQVLGDDPSRLSAALQQLGSAFPGQRLTPAIVSQQFRGLGEQKIWDLCDKAFSRDLAGAIRSWRSIEEGGDDALKVLGGVSSRLRDLIRVQSVPERTPPDELAKAAGLRFGWQATRYRRQAANFSGSQLVRLHARVTEADRALKSGASGDTIMPALVVAIAGA